MNTEVVSLPAGTQHLQTELSSLDNIRQLLAVYLNDNIKAAISLLNVNGVDIPGSAPKSTVTVAFLKAITDSAQFRNQASTALTNYVQSMNQSNGFIPAFRNAVSEDPEPWLGQAYTPEDAAPPAKKSIWDTLGGVFTPDVIKSGINTGLGAVSTSIQSKANSKSEQNALELERLRLAQIQAGNESGASAGGMSSGAKIGIAVGAIAVVGIIIFMVAKK